MFYKHLDVGFKSMLKNKNVMPMLKPSHVKKAHKYLNAKVLNTIGESIHLQTYRDS